MATARFAQDLSSAEAARRFAVDELRRLDVGEDTLFRVQLLVTELVTNAVRHARSAVDVTVERQDHLIRIEARDESSALPTPPYVDTPTRHRGLLLIEDLCQRWGVDTHAHPGKVVWCELSPGSRVQGELAVAT